MTLGPFQFDSPWWLALAPALWLVAWWMSRRAIAGLSPGLRRVALGIRLALIAALVMALARPHWRTRVDDLAVVAVLDMSDSMPPGSAARAATYLRGGAERADANDRLGLVLTAGRPLVSALPGAQVRAVEPSYEYDTGSTDLAAAVRLATAVLPEDAASRIVLITDGNETEGGLLSAVEAARAAGATVDVLPVRYDIRREVIVDQIIAPANARQGQTVNLRFVMTSTAPTRGLLTLFAGDAPVDLDPGSPGVSVAVSLREGVNIESVPVTLPAQGAQRFRAVFEPFDPADDAIAENNAAESVTFVSGEGRVLVLADAPDEHGALVDALERGGMGVVLEQTPASFGSLVDLAAYDAIVLAGTGAYGFSLKQQEELRAYVHDIGGGLFVLGGPGALGAGGWIGSPLADALPLKLDPPQEQRTLKGALAIVLDASGSMSIPVGSVSQQTIANEAAAAAVKTLTRSDEVLVLAFDSVTRTIVPLGPNVDPDGISRAIRGIGPGGGTNMFPALARAAIELEKSDAASKHIVVLSDGQTMGNPEDGRRAALRIRQLGGTLTGIAVGPGADVRLLEDLSKAGGGRFFALTTERLAQTLPAVFVRDVQTALRTLIWEGEQANPTITAISEALRGIPGLPPYRGYVVTTEREGLSLVTAKTHQGDPLLAQWQHGLGRVVVFTSDGTSRWTPSWGAWDGYRSFVEQHVRWAMRPTGSANLNVVTQQQGDSTRVIVEALDASGEPLNFARFQGRIVAPDGVSAEVDLRMTSPGRYEGRAPTPGEGVFTLNLRYDTTGSPVDAAPGSREQLADRGSVQAAIVKPAAAERRTLTSNDALLERAAMLGGGRVLSGNPETDNLFSREGMPRAFSARSIWLPLTLLALVVFLTDVAVRRVRIDLETIRALAAKLSRKEAKASEQPVGALRTAREKAKERIATKEAAAAAATKFEARPAPVAKRANTTDDDDLIPLDTNPGAREQVLAQSTKARADDAEQGGMSRLMQAKKRAQQARQNPDHRSLGPDDTN
ncbi:MAG: VWA domain-containing protein [Phycisphaeraceae bacterium]|nr:VWA domain-containing protein [Phycisphaeraceae bacterium]